jgi:nucleoid-associated protein YgaU
VKENDTLSTISQEQLGTAKRWREILQLNNLSSERDLRPGMELRLPPDGTAERFADRPATRR